MAPVVGPALAWVTVLMGCGDAVVVAAGPESSCEPPSFLAPDGRCVVPSAGPLGCPAGEAAFQGRCVPAGVPPEACGPFFEPDGERGCRPILPAASCPEGEMAVPGDTVCAPVKECGQAPWGGVETGPSTVYVLESYAGTDSDGTAARPFRRVDDALAMVPPEGVIAIGPGRYETPELVVDQPGVQLRGLCPQQVELRGIGDGAAVRLQADDTGLSGVAVTGGRGVVVAGDGATVGRVWVHDTTDIAASNGGGWMRRRAPGLASSSSVRPAPGSWLARRRWPSWRRWRSAARG